MSKPDELAAFLFDGRGHPLAAALLGWMEASPRFAAFAEQYKDKLRKKIRLAQNSDSALDLGCELEAAYRLFGDRRLSVAYEPYASLKKRSPDFAVTYRANLVFNVEVTRIRMEAQSERREAAAHTEGEPSSDQPLLEGRLLRTLLGKLEQCLPGMPNLLVMHCPPEPAGRLDLAGLMQELKLLADSRSPALYAAVAYPSPAAFYKDFNHLNGVLLWAPGGAVWANKQARPGLDEKVLRLAAACFLE